MEIDTNNAHKLITLTSLKVKNQWERKPIHAFFYLTLRGTRKRGTKTELSEVNV